MISHYCTFFTYNKQMHMTYVFKFDLLKYKLKLRNVCKDSTPNFDKLLFNFLF